MRTLLIVVMLMVVALAAGASFFVRAGAQEPQASLDYVCDPQSVPEGVDTLLRCRVVATNTGTVPLPDVWFGFVPAPDVAIPDRYYFFAARLDGIPLDINSGQINYDLGAIPPGGERVLELDVIVRVTQPSGALAQLYSLESGYEFAQQTLIIEPSDDPAPVEMRMEAHYGAAGEGTYRSSLAVSGSVEVTEFTADLGLYENMSIPAVYARQERMQGEDVFGEKFHLPIVRTAAPTTTSDIPFDVQVEPACSGGTVAAVGYVRAADGTVYRPALLFDLSVPETCYESGDVTGLARGGFGPQTAVGWPVDAIAVALLAAGLLTLVGGVAVEARGPTRPAPRV